MIWRKLALAALVAAGSAQAEVNEVRMSKQFGLPYLPMIVIEAQQLIEKNARAAGLGDVATSWTQRAGPAAPYQPGREQRRDRRSCADLRAVGAQRNVRHGAGDP